MVKRSSASGREPTARKKPKHNDDGGVEVVVFRDPEARKPVKWQRREAKSRPSEQQNSGLEFDDVHTLSKEVSDFGIAHTVWKEKKYMEKKRVEALGVQGKRVQRPYHIHMGMKKKQEEREEKQRELEALSGVKLSAKKRTFTTRKRDSGGVLKILPGKLQGGTLHVRRSMGRSMGEKTRGRGRGRGRGRSR